MAILYIPEKNYESNNFSEIQAYLKPRGILHEQWQADHTFPPDASQEEVLAAYASTLRPYMAQNGYQVADVIVVHPATPNLTAIRDKFLREHTHTEDEVRFFVEGKGYFWFNLENEEPVFCLCCLPGDLISVPANFRHWFDLGTVPFVKAIRIFIDPAGWIPEYTASGIDQQFSIETFNL